MRPALLHPRSSSSLRSSTRRRAVRITARATATVTHTREFAAALTTSPVQTARARQARVGAGRRRALCMAGASEANASARSNGRARTAVSRRHAAQMVALVLATAWVAPAANATHCTKATTAQGQLKAPRAHTRDGHARSRAAGWTTASATSRLPRVCVGRLGEALRARRRRPPCRARTPIAPHAVRVTTHWAYASVSPSTQAAHASASPARSPSARRLASCSPRRYSSRCRRPAVWWSTAPARAA